MDYCAFFPWHKRHNKKIEIPKHSYNALKQFNRINSNFIFKFGAFYNLQRFVCKQYRIAAKFARREETHRHHTNTEKERELIFKILLKIALHIRDWISCYG